MAKTYYNRWICDTFNRNGQRVYIQFMQYMEEVPFGMEEPTAYVVPLVDFRVEYMNGNEEKYDPTIISAKAVFKLRARTFGVGTLNAESLYANAYDEWKVIAKIDDNVVFTGFVTMENEPYQLKDKPYNVVVTATDGLGLLKNVPLTMLNGNDFSGRNTLLSYIAGALGKTNLNINIKAYVNIYNTAHNNRFTQGSPDMLTQTRLHHRTFLNDEGNFIDCYSALELILSKWCVLYQYEGDWLISEVSEMMESIGPQRYFTEYSYTGVKITSAKDYEDVGLIGKVQKIQPINIDQYVSYQPPVKSVKTIYNYEVPKDLINNEDIRSLGALISPLSGPGYAAYQLFGWQHFKGVTTNESPSSVTAYIKTEYNQYNSETDRYYVVPKDTSAANTLMRNFIKNTNTDFFVSANDVISVTVTARTKVNYNSSVFGRVGQLHILIDGRSGASQNDYYTINQNGNWQNIANNSFAVFDTTVVNDTTAWTTFSFSNLTVPVDGYIFLKLGVPGDLQDNNEVHFKDVKVEYTPYVKGSRFSLKGDYWITIQNTNIKDVLAEEIDISDAPKKVIKGALWDNSGNNLLNPTWYRIGYNEQKHFKELANLGRYRHQQFRNKRISGTFKGVTWSPIGTVTQRPLCFHRHFLFENEQVNSAANYYMLTAPLDIDYLSCQWRGTLINSCVGPAYNVTQGDTHTFNYIF